LFDKNMLSGSQIAEIVNWWKISRWQQNGVKTFHLFLGKNSE